MRAMKKKQEGAVMLIVMFILLMSTATAMFAVHSSAFEIRSAGHFRQAQQAQVIAESGLASAMLFVDQMGPAAILQAMQRMENDSRLQPVMQPFEPNLASGKRNYRLYVTDLTRFSALPIDQESTGTRSAETGMFLVDINDEYTYTGTIAGHRSDGGSKLQYLQATYTARGRTRVRAGDITSTVSGDRQYHETAIDARAYGVSGPFGQ